MKTSSHRPWLRRTAIVAVAAIGVALGVSAAATPAMADTTPIEASALRIVDSSGSPVAQVSAQLTSSEAGSYPAYALSNSQGVVNLADAYGVQPELNPYHALLSYNSGTASQYWDGATDADSSAPIIIVDDGPTLDVTLSDVQQPTLITGKVTGADGVPIVGASVYAGGGDVTGYATSAADGSYSVSLAGSGSSAIVYAFSDTFSSAAPHGYALTYWNKAFQYEDATPVVLTANSTTSGIDIELVRNEVVSGTVSEVVDGKLTPIVNAPVGLIPTGSDRFQQSTNTDASGSYYAVVPSGSYTVGFGSESGASISGLGFEEVDQYYDQVTDIADATQVKTSGSETTGINAVFGTLPGPDAVVPGTVTITGDGVVGQTLTATSTGWDPADVSLSYQWFRGIGAIEGATGASYKLTPADAGHKISVGVTGSKTDLTPAYATSVGIGPVTDPNPGTVVVNVTKEDGTTGSGYVQLANKNGAPVFHGADLEGGRVAFSDVAPGEYSVTLYPDTGVSQSADVTVAASTESVVELVQVAPVYLPAGVSLTPSYPAWNGGAQLSGGPTQFSVQGQPGAVSATWQLLADFATTPTSEGALTESPAGTYSATIPGAAGGAYTLTATLTFADGTTSTVAVDIYIDPSGTVVDQYGAPVEGATVTISRSDTEAGPFTDVPDGSALLSPSNRTNPDVTGADGYFGWDTVPGWYKVTASKVVDGTEFTVTTDALPVPPEQLDLVLALPGGAAPEPTQAPVISGDAAPNGTLTVSDGLWPSNEYDLAPIEALAYQWTKNGAPIEGATSAEYLVTESDNGARIGVVLTVGRDLAADAGKVLSWQYDVTSVLIDGEPLPSPTSTPGATTAPGGGSNGGAHGGGSNGDGSLATTGAEALPVAGIAGLLLLGGAAFLLLKRREAAKG